MASPKTCARNSGFSLIEILIVLGLLVVLSGLALAINLDSYRSYTLQSERNLIIGLLQKARSQAMNNINQKPHGLKINQGAKTYTLFQGPDYEHHDIYFDAAFEGNGNYLLSGLDEIVFQQLSGRSDTTGTITLDNHIQPPVNIQINAEGQIN